MHFYLQRYGSAYSHMVFFNLLCVLFCVQLVNFCFFQKKIEVENFDPKIHLIWQNHDLLSQNWNYSESRTYLCLNSWKRGFILQIAITHLHCIEEMSKNVTSNIHMSLFDIKILLFSFENQCFWVKIINLSTFTYFNNPVLHTCSCEIEFFLMAKNGSCSKEEWPIVIKLNMHRLQLLKNKLTFQINFKHFWEQILIFVNIGLIYVLRCVVLFCSPMRQGFLSWICNLKKFQRMKLSFYIICHILNEILRLLLWKDEKCFGVKILNFIIVAISDDPILYTCSCENGIRLDG